jgi:hypothetical protein
MRRVRKVTALDPMLPLSRGGGGNRVHPGLKAPTSADKNGVARNRKVLSASKIRSALASSGLRNDSGEPHSTARSSLANIRLTIRATNLNPQRSLGLVRQLFLTRLK